MSQLAALVQAQVEYHRQAAQILQQLSSKMDDRSVTHTHTIHTHIHTTHTHTHTIHTHIHTIHTHTHSLHTHTHTGGLLFALSCLVGSSGEIALAL